MNISNVAAIALCWKRPEIGDTAPVFFKRDCFRLLLGHNLLSFDGLIIGFARLPLVPEVFCYIAAKLDLRPKLDTFIKQRDIKIFLPRRRNIKQSADKLVLESRRTQLRQEQAS